jgi:gluconokinase
MTAYPGSGEGSEETAMSKTADAMPREHGPATVVVVVGVSGSGKSTVGQELADALGVPFVDGDDLHSEQNVAKMHAGLALTDADRLPWLAALAARIGALSADHGGVIACSALKRRYRDALSVAAPDVLFLQLDLGPETAQARVAARKGHFMPSSLVTSQFEDLEPLEPEEPGMALDATEGLQEKIDTFREHLKVRPAVREKTRDAARARRPRAARAGGDEGTGEGEPRKAVHKRTRPAGRRAG